MMHGEESWVQPGRAKEEGGKERGQGSGAGLWQHSVVLRVGGAGVADSGQHGYNGKAGNGGGQNWEGFGGDSGEVGGKEGEGDGKEGCGDADGRVDRG